MVSPSPWPAGDGGGTNGLPGSVALLSPPPVYSLGSCASPAPPCLRLQVGSKKRGAAFAPQLQSSCLPCFLRAKPSPSSPRTCHGCGSWWPRRFSFLRSRSSRGKEGSRSCHLLLLACPRQDAVPVPGPRSVLSSPDCLHTPKQGRGGCSLAPSRPNNGRKIPPGQLCQAPPPPSQGLGCPGEPVFC